jgi:hypothetical protein
METIGIATSAMLVELNVSCWTARKLDKQVSEEVDAVKKTRARGGNYHKNLLAGSKSLEDVNKYAARIRLWNTQKTLPWSDKGTRLVTMSQFLDYKAELNAHETEFNRLCQKFFVEYPTLISAAAFSLGDMFNREEYPDVDNIMGKFRFTYAFTPVPTAGDFRIDINEQAKAELIQQYEANFNERIEGAMRDVWERLHKCLTHMSDRLANDEEGKRKGFHDTMLGNAKELVDLLNHLNITKDAKLDQAKRDLSSALLLVDTDMLKESDEIRLQTKNKVDDILSKFNW